MSQTGVNSQEFRTKMATVKTLMLRLIVSAVFNAALVLSQNSSQNTAESAIQLTDEVQFVHESKFLRFQNIPVMIES